MNDVYESQRREMILDRYRTWRKNDAYFRVCRRLFGTELSKIAPWDKVDKCQECGHDVLYDSRDSEASTPHVCIICAEINAMNVNELSALIPDKPKEEDIRKEQFNRRVEKAISQHRHSEQPRRLKPKLYPKPRVA